MSLPRAYYETPLVLGNHVLHLRPSLRAACALEKLHGGFPALLMKVEEFDTATIRQIVTHAATDTTAAAAFLRHASTLPLKTVADALQAPCMVLVASLLPTPAENTPKPQQAAPSIPWADLFHQLYGYATGWMGWPPATAWASSPQEILDAFTAHLAKLRAIHGGEAEADDDKQAVLTDAQIAEIVANGTDPSFDREGLRQLKAQMEAGFA